MNILDIKNIRELDQYFENLGGQFLRAIKNLEVNKDKKILYHYTSIYGLEGIIKNSEFWISHSDFLNDKTELKYTYELCKEIIREITSEDESLYKQVLGVFDNSYHKHENIQMFSLSLTTNGDSNLLWSNYSDNDGYNIAFDYPDIVNCLRGDVHEKNFTGFPGAVIYNKEIQKEFLQKELQMMIDLFILYLREVSEELNAELPKKFTDIALVIKLYSMFFKDSCFQQEEEFRIAFIGLDHKAKQEGFRISNGAFIPYIKASFKENKKVIESITIGPKNKMDIAKEGLSKFLNHYGYNNLKQENIKKSRIPYRY